MDAAPNTQTLRSSRGARREARVSEITRVAARLFARNGYGGTGISELADAVGLGKGALYYYIGSKEELLFRISSAHVESMIQIGEDLLNQDVSATHKLRELSRALMQTISDNLAEVTVFFQEYPHLTGERASLILERRRRFEGIWHAILSAGAASGELRPLNNVAIKGLLGMHNYAYVWLHPDGPLSPDEISEEFLNMVLAGIEQQAAPGPN